ncbi:DoxX family protein [Maribacter sp. PR1]|uniref:DoxX family protein n=1 Tax=Maribacter cobaltidurans TaxID=1178778 RepID=A0ABU7IY80_9FLAO|nr:MULTISPECIES: DoxX family protein [Maribacter]MDC6390553.1 DoxX family protein [Maribacter sp. PR1]MEE1977944.1 DoxX family protein [Maribacter cobaltidurans]
MNHLQEKIIKVFLRVALSTAFLSAVFDRLGSWPKEVSAWGNWENFLNYTHTLLPWIPDIFVPFVGLIATVLEVVFAICLLTGFKTELFAKLSGILLLCFALSMTFTTGLKASLDYSVFTAAAAAFSLSMKTNKYFEVDSILKKNKS